MPAVQCVRRRALGGYDLFKTTKINGRSGRAIRRYGQERCFTTSPARLDPSSLTLGRVRSRTPLVKRATTSPRFYSSSSTSAAQEPTIYALSTAPGRSAIAIIRTSGPLSTHIYHSLCPTKPLPSPRHAVVRALYHPSKPPSQDTILDPSALVLYFPSPKSFTGEDILELHVHGGPAVIKAVLSAISTLRSPTHHIRYAEKGEFSLRAFHNSRLSLPQIEALSDTLTAETEQQRLLSVRGSSSALPALYESWRQHLLSARGELEALIDFAEDQHFDESPAELCESISGQVRGLIALLEVHVRNAVKGELLRNGISVALLGLPNAGKSSLLNVIVGREAAIVAEEAGTTRDVVDVGLDLDGWFVRFGDTAGVRKGLEGRKVGQVEEEGIRRAKARAMESDVVVVVLDLEPSSSPREDADVLSPRVDPELQTFIHGLPTYPSSLLVAINKADLLTTSTEQSRILDLAHSAFPSLASSNFHFISCKAAAFPPPPTASPPPPSSTTINFPSSSPNQTGIQPLLSALTTHFTTLTGPSIPSWTDGGQQEQDLAAAAAASDHSLYTASLGASHRQRDLLSTCLTSLHSFLAELHPHPALGTGYGDEDVAEVDIVVAAEHLRRAAESLARITGRGEGSGDVEEVLGVVFERFCVGK